MANGLAELKQACRAVEVRTQEEILHTGGSVWFMGRPAEAQKGMIAIAQSEEMHLLIREEDILEAERKEDLFLVRVRSEANVLARFQTVMKAGSQGCECDVGDDAQTGLARQLSQQGPWGDPIGPPFLRCRLFVYCFYIYGRRVCYWWIFCPSRIGSI